MMVKEDSGKVVINGTGLWLSRGKPFAAVVLILGPICVSGGMHIQRLKNLELEIASLKSKVEKLEDKAVNGLMLQSAINDTNAYAKSAHDKAQQLRAELTVLGVLGSK